MNNSEPTIEPMTVCKILIPTIVLAITFLVPRWYWIALDHQQADKKHEQAKEHASTKIPSLGARSQTDDNSKNTEDETNRTPWYDKPRVIAVITLVYCIFA